MTDDIRARLIGAKSTLVARFCEDLSILLARGRLYASLAGVHYKSCMSDFWIDSAWADYFVFR
jgi:hypothetical protein